MWKYCKQTVLTNTDASVRKYCWICSSEASFNYFMYSLVV